MRADQRLRRKSDFDAVFEQGISTSSGVLALRAMRRSAELSEHPCRYGFAVSSRLGNAVVRNRIRRRLRASARQLNDEGGCLGLDVVVIARGGAAEADFQRLDDTLRRLVRRSTGRLTSATGQASAAVGRSSRGAS